MTATQATPDPQAAGATLHLGGTAYCTPDLEPLLVPIDQLHPFPGNARRGDQDAITSSVRDLGVWRAHVAQTGTGHIMVGNHQLRALLDLGATVAPASWRDCDDDTARAIAIRDNHTSDLGAYNQDDLLALYRATDQSTGGLGLAGLTTADLTDLERAVSHAMDRPSLTDPDDAPPLPTAPPLSQAGDVWRLGPHRLVVGDATEALTYTSLLGAERAACVWTDPPYGVNYVGKQLTSAMTIQNDQIEGLVALLEESFKLAVAHCEPGASWYVSYADKAGSVLPFLQTLAHLGLYRQNIAWVKDQFVLGHGDYHSRYEPVAYGWVPGTRRRHPVEDRTQSTVWEIPRPRRSDDHPTMKPVELVARALRNSTRPGDTVLDPFAGSGTTLIACHQEDRTARLIELDPAYADVICRRYQQHTGTLPVRDGTQIDFLGGDDG